LKFFPIIRKVWLPYHVRKFLLTSLSAALGF